MDGKRLTVAVVLLALNQLSGINIVLPYSKQLFMKVSYYHEEGANYYLEVLAVAQVIATLAGGWLANKYGRKRVLLAGAHVATATLFAIFAVSTLSPKSVMLLVGLIVLFTIAYAGTVGVVPLLYLAELFPTLSGVNTIYWAFSLVGMLSSNLMLSQLGIGKSFFIYGAVSFLCTYVLESEMIESHRKTSKELRNEYLYHNKDEGSVLQYASMKNTDAIIEDSNSLIDLEQ
jgi:MFS family permease